MKFQHALKEDLLSEVRDYLLCGTPTLQKSLPRKYVQPSSCEYSLRKSRLHSFKYPLSPTGLVWECSLYVIKLGEYYDFSLLLHAARVLQEWVG